MSDHLIEDYMVSPCSNFLSEHLNGTRGLSDIVSGTYLKNTIKTFQKANTTTDYVMVCKLLNYLSKKIHDQFAADSDLILFVDHHTATPKFHPNDVDAKPDVIAVLKSTWKKYQRSRKSRRIVSWHDILSAVEAKPTWANLEGVAQCGSYGEYLNQARPDMPSVYCLTMSSRSYEILYSDASGLYVSTSFSWSTLRPLAQYIYTLYVPRADRLTFDPTISLAEPGSITQPTWNVEFNNKVYKNCEVTFVGEPWRRMSWIAIAPATEDEPKVAIKDSYRSVGRTWREGDLFDILQQKESHVSCTDPEYGLSCMPETVEPGAGPAPGWVHVIAHGDVSVHGGLIQTPKTCCRRIKTRLVMGSTGDPLAKCRTILEFLKVMYDILEAHRWAVATRNILHRDISWANILVHPEGSQTTNLQGHRPKFIDELLSGVPHSPSNALLFDLDNACELDRSRAKAPSFAKSLTRSPSTERLRAKTGTPMYISRSVGQGRLLWDQHDCVPMPVLTGAAEVAYHQAYSDIPLRCLADSGGSTHGGKYSDEFRKELRRGGRVNGSNTVPATMLNPFTGLSSSFYCALNPRTPSVSTSTS
ncbi:hypothetical protein HGRIS_006634 [Hohenbuehelia grisea]|uniref:Fungal-type protein kinase domain-containing protein n=1 Tax=Hohenbuehelia grisea TaxID=104357 RepID=A0ABR3J9L7_9AGAR